MTPTADSPIGVFDSGAGGLSVLRAIRARLPNESTLYFGDQQHVPYGLRATEQIQRLSETIARFLLARDVKIVVIACNTASAAALKFLRGKFPRVRFVGMEPAIKPAVERTRTGKVGVLATPATFQGELYASVIGRFANGVELHQSVCEGLVQQIERGDLTGSETRRILHDALKPMAEKQVDVIVLGCTHYPFVIPLIQEIAGADAQVIDPAPAVARQVERLLEADELKNASAALGTAEFFTSGDPSAFSDLLSLLLGETSAVKQARWSADLQTLSARNAY